MNKSKTGYDTAEARLSQSLVDTENTGGGTGGQAFMSIPDSFPRTVQLLSEENKQLKAEVERLTLERDNAGYAADNWQKIANERSAEICRLMTAIEKHREHFTAGINLDDTRIDQAHWELWRALR